LVPQDAQVEIMAKVHAGYNAGNVFKKLSKEELKHVKGRATHEDIEE
jgi:bacteriocin-like protein